MTNADTPSAQPSGTASESALYQCATCKKSYVRVDHLTRHVRSHTQVRPYHCSVCPKQFARIDLLKRHKASHDAGQDGPKRRKLRGEDSGGPRVSQACVLCAVDHLRCSEQKPCTRCVGKNVTCQWQGAAVVQGDAPAQLPPGEPEELDLGPVSHIGQLPTEESHEPPSRDPEPRDNFTPHLRTGRFSLPDTNTMRMTIPPGELSGTWTPRGLPEFAFETNIDLSDLDLSFLDAYNTQIPFDFGDAAMLNPELARVVESGPSMPANIGVAAFQNSHWRFRPNKRDHGAAEQSNLSLPVAHESPESRIPIPKPVTSAKLTASSRDKMLVMVLDSCSPENRPRVVDFFPSAELLDILVQYCLTSETARVDEFIHLGTLNPNKLRPELLAAIVAYGAVLTADSALSKLGFAIQECVRTTVPKHWERENATTRDLQYAQAFLIILEIGMWSGNSRKMEISESFLQPLVTMMRRGGKFRSLAYRVCGRSTPEQPPANDAGVAEDWKLWVTSESFKRLTFRILQHDTHVSMALLVPPLISYTEFQLPLPEPQEAWMAGSAEIWQAQRPEMSMDAKIPSLVNFMNDLNCLDRCPGMIDCRHAQFAFSSGAWRLAWEYIQLQRLRKDQSRQWNGLLLESRCDELTKFIEQFRMSFDLGPQSQLPSDIVLRLELILMHLHTPLEDIQLYAGIEGPEEAQQTLPALSEWTTSSSARRAIWHAGQVLRAARNLPEASLRFFPAVALYHASLVFWAYGLLPKEAKLPTTGNAHYDDTTVALDSSDETAVRRFIQIERGSPAIRASSGSTRMVLLKDPSEVMRIMVAEFHSNFAGQEMPALVKNLVQLVYGLQSAAESSLCQV